MMYTIKFIDQSELQITEEEYKKLAGKSGLVFIPSSKQTINMNSISRIFPVGTVSKKVEREKQMIGVTPEGETVEKRFGVWYYQKSNNEFHYDDNGVCTLRYEGRQILPTPTEYESVFHVLPEKEWLPALAQRSEGTLNTRKEARLVEATTQKRISDKTCEQCSVAPCCCEWKEIKELAPPTKEDFIAIGKLAERYSKQIDQS